MFVREKDAWGCVRYFVEESRLSSEARLVREDDQHGPVIWYVEPYEIAGESDGRHHREPTALDRFVNRQIFALANVLSDLTRRYGTMGLVIATLVWIAGLTALFLVLGHIVDLGLLGSLLYGVLVMGGIMFIVSYGA